MDTNNIKQKILEKIQKGEVKMRPKAFFIAKVVLFTFVLFLIFILAVFLVSYALFSISTGGGFFLLSFGGRGLFEFFIVFPWLILLILVGLILFLDWLLKEFRFAYHHPALYVFIGSVLIITALGSVVSMTSLHKNLLQMAENKHLPVPGVRSFYTDLRRSRKDEGIFRGEVTFVSTSSFKMKGMGEQDVFTVYVPSGYQVSQLVIVGDEVFIAGDILSENEVKAYGIKKVSSK